MKADSLLHEFMKYRLRKPFFCLPLKAHSESDPKGQFSEKPSESLCPVQKLFQECLLFHSLETLKNIMLYVRQRVYLKAVYSPPF